VIPCADWLLRTRGSDSVTVVVTGDDGQADEDLACAQYIARRAAEAEADAAEFVRRAPESRAAAELAEGVRQGVHPDDVALCLEVDRFPFAMVAGASFGRRGSFSKANDRFSILSRLV
jgi:2-phosphosulfolactate phosphatase